ncbi:RHS domain-containing protein [Burkholderia cepacia]|uniref:RHS domain-containing protein n=1 Tax=Burkholderia cepacia TaxID=292 RepID=UPI001E527282|nr:RHS domain-containing protein [Burkholderia cepacia]
MPLGRIDLGKPAANGADVRGAVYYFHNNVSGLPEELTDADGGLIWQARYKVWGDSVQEEWIAGRRSDRRRHGVRCRKLGYVCPCTTAAELALPRAVPGSRHRPTLQHLSVL